MNPTEAKTDKGILKAKVARQKFTLSRYPPSSDLSRYIEHYWLVRWDLRGQDPYRQVILSYPNVNLSFENDHRGIYCGIYGVPKTTSSHHLQDEGTVFGVKFKPGGFYPFWSQPVSRLTGLSVPCAELFGIDMLPLTEQVLALTDGQDMVAVVESFLCGRSPEPDGNVELIDGIIQTVIGNREVTKVEHIVSQFGIGKRTLQRLFSRYVGVSPKWIIQRFRLQEAADRLEKGEVAGWPELSVELGYYDQAHFIKDFRAILGKSPEEYRMEIG